MKKALLFLAVITLLLSLPFAVSAANDYYVYNPIQLKGHITVGGGLQIIDDTKLDNGKLFVSIEANKTDASNNSLTVITINTTGFASDVKANEYPVIKISYRSDIACSGSTGWYKHRC